MNLLSFDTFIANCYITTPLLDQMKFLALDDKDSSQILTDTNCSFLDKNFIKKVGKAAAKSKNKDFKRKKSIHLKRVKTKKKQVEKERSARQKELDKYNYEHEGDEFADVPSEDGDGINGVDAINTNALFGAQSGRDEKSALLDPKDVNIQLP